MKTYPTKAAAEGDLKLAQKVDRTAFPQRVVIDGKEVFALRVGRDKWFDGAGKPAVSAKLVERPVCPVCKSEKATHLSGCSAPRTAEGYAHVK